MPARVKRDAVGYQSSPSLCSQARGSTVVFLVAVLLTLLNTYLSFHHSSEQHVDSGVAKMHKVMKFEKPMREFKAKWQSGISIREEKSEKRAEQPPAAHSVSLYKQEMSGSTESQAGKNEVEGGNVKDDKSKLEKLFDLSGSEERERESEERTVSSSLKHKEESNDSEESYYYDVEENISYGDDASVAEITEKADHDSSNKKSSRIEQRKSTPDSRVDKAAVPLEFLEAKSLRGSTVPKPVRTEIVSKSESKQSDGEDSYFSEEVLEETAKKAAGAASVSSPRADVTKEHQDGEDAYFSEELNEE